MTEQQTDKRECDLLIRDGYLITMDDERRIYSDGAIAIAGTRIAGVGVTEELLRSFAPRRVINAEGGTVHPGFIDCHMHVSFLIWRWAFAETVSWPDYIDCHARYYEVVTAEEEYASTRLGCLELAKNGTTCYLEAGSVLEPDAAAEGTEQVGIRGVLGDPLIADLEPPGQPKFGRTRPSARRASELLGGQLRRNNDPDALVRGHVALRGIASASEELLRAASGLANQHGVVFNQHQSYNKYDVRDDDERFGRHPMVHFGEIGLLDQHCTWSHLNWVRDDEVRPILESGMTIVWCPTASMILSVGATFRGRHSELAGLGAPIALGSDSANSCGRYDVTDQAYLAVLTAREKTLGDGLSAGDALEMLTRQGARAVGLTDEVGSLEIGKRADLVIHRLDLPEALPGVDRVRQLVYSQRSRSVDTVVVDGEVIVEGGRSTRVDEEEVYRRAREASASLLRSAEKHPESVLH